MIRGGRIKSIFLLILIAAGLTSCLKEEDPVILPPTGNGEVRSVVMGPKYDKVVFFDLSTQNSWTRDLGSWELGFEGSVNGFHVIINGGLNVLVSNTGDTDFNAVTSIAGAEWKWDTPNGHPDSTAFGNWRDPFKNSLRQVYIIDRGDTLLPRYKKIVIENADDVEYTIRYANLDGSDHHILDIPKQNQVNYVRFSFKSGGNVNPFEPDMKEWDIVFTYYRHIFYNMNPVTPYRVCGVLSNRGVEVALDSTSDFYNIDYNHVQGLSYSTDEDAIGYTWKSFNYANANQTRYQIKSNINYIIKDSNNIYYKLRFLDFYDNNNVKGTPKFEFLRLKP